MSETCRQGREIQNIIKENDIALIQVKVPFDFTDTSIARICLPNDVHTNEYPPNGTDVVAVSWGRNEAGHLTDALQQVTMRVVDQSTNTCDSVVYNHRRQLCASPTGNSKTFFLISFCVIAIL